MLDVMGVPRQPTPGTTSTADRVLDKQLCCQWRLVHLVRLDTKNGATVQRGTNVDDSLWNNLWILIAPTVQEIQSRATRVM